MSYIAVDTFGDEYIYQFKPKRVIRTNTLGEKWGYWYSEKVIRLRFLKVLQKHYIMQT